MKRLNRQGILLIMMFFILLNEGQAQNFFTQNTTTGLPTFVYTFDVRDVENDGDLDVLVSDFTNVHIYTNNGSGSFTKMTGTAFSSVNYSYANVKFIDIDGDNDQDVLIVSAALGTTGSQLYRNDGGSTFTQINTFPAASIQFPQVAVGDLDNDNDEDIVITGTETSHSANKYSPFINDGSGNFSATVGFSGQLWNGSSGQIPQIVDLNGDNDNEILLSKASDVHLSYTFTNTRIDILLAPSSATPNTNGIAADLDGDGDNDVIGNLGETNYIAFNNGFASFTTSSQTLAAGTNMGLLAVGDVDNDGDIDFLRKGTNAAGTSYMGGLYINDGTGYVYLNSAISVADIKDGQAMFADLNGDNYPELLMCSTNTDAFYFYDNTYTTNHPDKAVDFDGTNYYTANHDAALNTLPMTIELKVQDAAAAPGGLIKKLSGNNGFHLGLNSGYLYASYAPDASNSVISNQAYQITANTWTHIAVVIETTGMKLYVDGTLHSTSNWTGTASAISNTVGLELGTWGLTTDKLSGNLDEVRIWNTARTHADIVNNMCRKISNPTNEANLVAYYSMDDYITGNNVILDNSSKRNTATITGGTQALAAEQTGCTAPSLPVEFISFTGRLRDNSAILNWITATEENNEGFEIQRAVGSGQFATSSDLDWETIGFVQGNGTTTEISKYEFEDGNLGGLDFYYRLKQIDYDGNFEYSNIVNITIQQSGNPTINIFPNPVNDILNIETNEPTFIQMTNTNGQVVKEQQVNATSTISVKDLPNGIYFLKTGNTTKKIIIQH